MKKVILAVVLLIPLFSPAKQPTFIEELSRAIDARTAKAPATGLIETGFSPDAGAEELVLKVINASKESIHLAAYFFTSPLIVKALVAAKRRGVDVRAVIDEKSNTSKASVAALNLLANAGIPTTMVSTYAIHHDKYIISDQKHVQTGSFNYSKAAARSNSENVMVVWNNPTLAATFARHWQSRWVKGQRYRSKY